VLVDRELAQFLRGRPEYRVRPLRRVSVRGYDHLQPWLVRRRPADDDSPIEGWLDEFADDVLGRPGDPPDDED
jgi:adenylate cyclase